MPHRPRTLVVAVVALCLHAVAAPALADDRGPFVDDDGHPGEPYLEWLAERGMIQGCNPPAETEICPDLVMTGAEAAQIAVAVGREVGTLPPLPSSLPDRVVNDAALWHGVVSRMANFLARSDPVGGCDVPVDPMGCPTDTLTRGQVAMLLVAVLGLRAPDSFSSPWTDTAGRFYEDAARVAGFHDIWDSGSTVFAGGTPVPRAEFARAIVAAVGYDLCPPDPFTAVREALLVNRHPGQSFTAYAYDTRTGCAYWMYPDERLRTASVFKVMVMAGTLYEAQDERRALSSWEQSQLVPMITESANDPVRALWDHFGGSPWFRRQAARFELMETTTVGDSESGWGRTTTSAKDQGDLIRQVLLGDSGPLEKTYRDYAWDLMASVVPSQTWGITNGVPPGWVVAQKNGFAGHIANSVGFVRHPNGVDGYVVAVLSNGWSNWKKGVPTVEEIAGWVSESLAR